MLILMQYKTSPHRSNPLWLVRWGLFLFALVGALAAFSPQGVR